MRIAIITNTFPKLSETFIINQVDQLAKLGHEVCVFCSHLDKVFFAKLFPASKEISIAVFSKRNMMLHYASHPQKFISIKKNNNSLGRAMYDQYLQHSINLFSPEIIHFEFSPLAMNYLSIMRFLKGATVVSCRGTGEKVKLLQYPERQELYKQLFSQVDSIHCVSEDMKNTITPFCNDLSKIFINYPAIDAEYFSGELNERKSTHTPFKILSVGRMTFAKGFANGLLVMKILKNKGMDFNWTIVGAGITEEELIFKRDQLGLNEQVILAGALSHADVKKEMENADLFFLPSVYEGLANVALESMSLGLPVVSTRSGGMAEAIEDGHDGLLAEVYDFEEQANCILRIANDIELAVMLGTNARQKVMEKFTIEKQMQKFISIYNEIKKDNEVA